MAAIATAVPPASTIDCTVSLIVPSNALWPASVVRAETATRAPSAAKRRAISAPMPRLAPVTMATRPSSDPICTPMSILLATVPSTRHPAGTDDVVRRRDDAGAAATCGVVSTEISI